MNRADALERYRVAAPSGHVHGGVALHRPARLRPRLLRPKRPCPGSDPGRVRKGHARDRRGRDGHGRGRHGRDRQACPDGVDVRAAARRPRAAGHARRRRRQVHGAQRRLLAERPPRPRAEGHGARRSALRPSGGRRHRRHLLAAARRRRGGQPLLAHRGVHVPLTGCGRLLERRRRALRRAGREARVRLASEPREGDLELRHPSRHRRAETRSSTGSPAASAPGAGRSASTTTWPGRGRRRGSPARTSPTARSTSTTTRSSSTTLRRRPPTSPSRARSASRRASSGEG